MIALICTVHAYLRRAQRALHTESVNKQCVLMSREYVPSDVNFAGVLLLIAALAGSLVRRS